MHGSVDLEGRTAVALELVRSEHPHRAYLVDPVTGAVGAELAREEECACQPVGVAIAGDGSVAVGVYMYFDAEWPPEDSGKLAVWSTEDGALQKQIDLPLWPSGVAVDHDGRLAVVNGANGYAVVDLETGTVRSVTDLPRWEPDIFMPLPVATTRDGLRAAVLRDRTVHVLTLPEGDELVSRDVGLGSGAVSEILSAAVWSADGSVLVTGSLGGQLQFLDGQTLEPVAPPRLTVGGYILTLAVSPDGSLLVNTGTDGEVRLWDTATWSPLGQPVVEDGGWAWAGFAEEGRELVVMTEGTSWDQEEIDADREGTAGRFYSLPTHADAWVEAACTIAGRELSQEEWDVIRPGQEWRPTCGGG
jgi:WD40 repeat protein